MVGLYFGNLNNSLQSDVFVMHKANGSCSLLTKCVRNSAWWFFDIDITIFSESALDFPVLFVLFLSTKAELSKNGWI